MHTWAEAVGRGKRRTGKGEGLGEHHPPSHHTHTHAHSHMLTYIWHSHTHATVPQHTPTHLHTHTHTHTHTHVHTHSLSRSPRDVRMFQIPDCARNQSNRECFGEGTLMFQLSVPPPLSTLLTSFGAPGCRGDSPGENQAQERQADSIVGTLLQQMRARKVSPERAVGFGS